MANRVLILWVAVIVLGYCQLSAAGDYDGSKSLQCKTSEGVQFHKNGGPQPFNPESVGLPKTFIIDFDLKEIRPTRQSVVQRRSKIKRIERVEDKIMLQGAEDGVEGVDDGVGWTLALVQGTGRFVISASGDDIGYIVFGGCQLSTR